jgi:hypothetical protein
LAWAAAIGVDSAGRATLERPRENLPTYLSLDPLDCNIFV